MKQIRCYLPLCLPMLCVPFAHAQSSVDFMVGGGTAHVGSNGGCIDSNTFTSYPNPSLDPAGSSACPTNPKLSGFFLGFGGDVMLFKHFGVGAEAAFQPSRSNYGPFQFRQTFYDFNGIFAPINTKRATVELQGGIGGAHTGYSINQCVGTAVCTGAQPVGTANHFAVHVGVGVSLFLTEHIFIRPQFDYRYVPGFTDQFSSNSVPAGMIWVGYNFGER